MGEDLVNHRRVFDEAMIFNAPPLLGSVSRLLRSKMF